MKRTNKLLSVLLALMMIISIIPMSSIETEAASNIFINGVDIGYAVGSYFTKNGKSCANSYWSNGKCHNHGICVDSTHSQCNCMRYWPTGKKSTCQVDLLSSQCMGFARYCQWKVYGYHDGQAKSKFTNLCAISSSSCTADTLKTKLLNCAPGTHIRTGNDSHSQSIISTTSSGVTVAECNVDGYCGVRTKTYSWSEYASYFKARGGVKYAYSFSASTGGTTSCTCSTSYAGNYTCTTTSSSLYIRSGHGTSYSTFGSIPKGATVYVSKADGSWAHVTYDGISGYASMSYLTKQTTQKSTLSLSTDTVYLTFGGTETATVNITINKNDSRRYTLSPSRSNSNVTTSWGDWNGTTAPLYITAKSQGTTVITIDLLDYETREKIDTCKINVYVTAKTYTVSYNANGGTGAPSSQTKTHGTALTLSNTIPTCSGYTFLGWSTSSTATSATYSAGGSFTTNANTTLYAVWQKNPVTVSSISVATMPAKTEYYVGDTFDSRGLVVKVTMSDGTTKTITSGFTVSSPNMSTAGTKTVTVTYESKTVSFTINVVEKTVTPDVPDTSFTFNIQEPSRTTIRHNDGIILHINVEGELPEDAKIRWSVNNNNFEGGYTEDGMQCLIVSKNNGYTTITATLYDANDNILATDSIEMRSKAGFFDKIGGFFRSLFGTTKLYEN